MTDLTGKRNVTEVEVLREGGRGLGRSHQEVIGVTLFSVLNEGSGGKNDGTFYLASFGELMKNKLSIPIETH